MHGIWRHTVNGCTVNESTTVGDHNIKYVAYKTQETYTHSNKKPYIKHADTDAIGYGLKSTIKSDKNVFTETLQNQIKGGMNKRP